MVVSEFVSLDLVMEPRVRSGYKHTGWVARSRDAGTFKVQARRGVRSRGAAARLKDFQDLRLPGRRVCREDEQHAQCVASTTLKKSQGSTPHDHDLRFQMGSRVRPRPGARSAGALGAGGSWPALQDASAR